MNDNREVFAFKQQEGQVANQILDTDFMLLGHLGVAVSSKTSFMIITYDNERGKIGEKLLAVLRKRIL